MTDYDHPYRVYYNFGLLEANTFGVNMGNATYPGVFTGMNSVSTPDQGKTIANLAQAYSSVKPAALTEREPRPFCNYGGDFLRYEAAGRLP